MPDFNTRKKKLTRLQLQTLIIASAIIGFLAALLAISLKHITEHYEDVFFAKAETNWFLFLILPFIGLSVIYILRKYLFKNKENKGIKEVFESFKTDKSLPAYKIPSHYLNGFLTVIFGGSTGIEVSTVVSSAAIGSIAHSKEKFLRKYKNELICAGTAAGIAALFTSPMAGFLFVYEVLSKKISKVFLIATFIAIGVATALSFFLHETALFAVNIQTWHWHAFPYFILLGIISGLNSVYLTKTVLFFKKKFANIKTKYHRVILGSAIIGISLAFFPELFGDGYHAIKENIATSDSVIPTLSIFLTLLGVIILKPIITSVTLSAGGDGGVFAPSIFIGAFIGLFTALLLNKYANAEVIPVNFMIIGMAAMLSASISAPFTALFLVCGLVGDYTLFFPILTVCFVSKFTAERFCSYTVYTYQEKATA